MKAVAALALLMSAMPAYGQAWEVGCDATGCKVGQAIVSDGTMEARVLVLQLQENEVIEVLFPLGVSLLSPLFLEVDGRQRFDIRTASCDGTGCYGIVTDAVGAVAAFKKGAEMKLHFTGFKDGAMYHFSFTLSGFTAAYDRYRSGTP